MSEGISWLFGLDDFTSLFSYLPNDVSAFLLVILAVLVVLGIRRVII